MEPDYWESQVPLLDHWGGGALAPPAPPVPTPLSFVLSVIAR